MLPFPMLNVTGCYLALVFFFCSFISVYVCWCVESLKQFVLYSVTLSFSQFSFSLSFRPYIFYRLYSIVSSYSFALIWLHQIILICEFRCFDLHWNVSGTNDVLVYIENAWTYFERVSTINNCKQINALTSSSNGWCCRQWWRLWRLFWW